MENIVLLKTSLIHRYIENLQNCSAKNEMLKLEQGTGEEKHCPPFFDDYACWDEAQIGTNVTQICPEMIMGFDPNRTVSRSCTENGTWYVNPDTIEPWSTYSDCIDVEELSFSNTMNNIYMTMYPISTIAVIFALLLLIKIKTLKLALSTLHMHQFVTIFINNCIWLFCHKVLVQNADIIINNSVWCRCLHIATVFFMASSNMWMFNDAMNFVLYLFMDFVNEKKAIKFYLVLGYIVPTFMVVLYVVVRLLVGNTNSCWINSDKSYYIIAVPLYITIGVAKVGILGILLLATCGNPKKMKWTDATYALLTLVTLFSIHFHEYPMRHFDGDSFGRTYNVLMVLITSSQALIVAIMYFVAKREFLVAMIRELRRLFAPVINEDLPMAVIHDGERAADNRDVAE